MIADCRDAGLPEPDFEQRGPHFVVTLWRDWLTNEVLASYDLNVRQRRLMNLLRTEKCITNTQYQETFSVAKRTASLDLGDLVEKGLIERVGTTGKGVHYRLAKGAPKGQKGQ